MIGQAPCSDITGIPGWLPEPMERRLIQFAYDVPDGANILHLGGEFGRDAAAFAHGAKRNLNLRTRIYTVRSFPPDLINAYRVNIEAAGFDDLCCPVNEDPLIYAKRWDKPVHILYLACTHNAIELESLMNAWLPKVVAEGFIIWRDYWKSSQSHPSHLPIKQAVDSWIKRHPYLHLQQGEGSLVWTQQPKALPQKIEKAPEIIDGWSIKQLQKLADDRGLKTGRIKKRETLMTRLDEAGIIEWTREGWIVADA